MRRTLFDSGLMPLFSYFNHLISSFIGMLSVLFVSGSDDFTSSGIVVVVVDVDVLVDVVIDVVVLVVVVVDVAVDDVIVVLVVDVDVVVVGGRVVVVDVLVVLVVDVVVDDVVVVIGTFPASTKRYSGSCQIRGGMPLISR